MFIYWQHNKNIILAAAGLFIVSMTALLFFLNGNVPAHEDLKADVVDSVALKSDIEQEKSYRAAMERSDGPFIVVSPDGMVDFLSWDYETMTGYTEPELKDQLFFSMVHPEDLPKLISAFGNVIASEKASQMVGPFRVRDAGGEYHLHMATIYPINRQGKVEKLIFSSVDITEEVQAGKENVENDEVSEDESIEAETEGEDVKDPKNADQDKDKEKPVHEKTSEGKKIRDENSKGEKRLVVDKLAMIFSPLLQDRPKLLSWVPYFLPPM